MTYSDYSTNVVNVNYRSRHDKSIDLKSVHSLLPNNSKLCLKPLQLVIRDEKGGTIIFFSNGKLRIMGCIDELEATFLAYKYIMMIDDDCDFQPVYSQTMTVRVVTNMRINLSKFVHETSLAAAAPFLQYEPELFPAVLVKKFKPISVNVFSSGKIIMCGVRDIQQVHDIMQDLKASLEMCKLV